MNAAPPTSPNQRSTLWLGLTSNPSMESLTLGLVNLGDQKVHKMVKFCVHQCTQTARRYEAPSLALALVVAGLGTRTRRESQRIWQDTDRGGELERILTPAG